MEKKKNSIDWAIEQISKVALDCRNGLSDKAFHVRKEEILEQAKAMHKEEIEEAYDAVIIDENGGLLDGKEYYNETFGTRQ